MKKDIIACSSARGSCGPGRNFSQQLKALLLLVTISAPFVETFAPSATNLAHSLTSESGRGGSATSLRAENKITMVDDPDAVAVPIAFVSPTKGKGKDEESTIMCHVDAIATIDDVDYSVGYPCDHAVDIAYIELDEDGSEGLVLIETGDPIMDDLFPKCKQIIEEDNADAKLALYRTPATLTLAGNLAIDDDADNEEDGDEEDEEDEGAADLLLTFEHGGKEYNLVRPTDLMLLVAKPDESNKEQRVLIDDDESESIMPTLMDMLGL